KILLLNKFRKNLVELSRQKRYQTKQKCLFEIKVGIVIAHGPPQNASDYIARTCIGRQLAICNGKSYRADMVGQNTESNGSLAIASIIFFIGDSFDFQNSPGEYIGIVVTAFILEHAHQPFKAQSGVDMFGREALERTVFQAIELHEHVVPYLNYLRMVGIYQIFSADGVSLSLGAAVDMDFAAWAAGACITHFPEIVF